MEAGRFYTETIVSVRNPYLFSHKGKIPRNILVSTAHIFEWKMAFLEKNNYIIDAFLITGISELLYGNTLSI